jgi:hypothetical protein
VMDAGAKPIDAGRPRPPTTGDPLSQAFARRQGEVGACFNKHASQVVTQPRVWLRFEIDVNGVPTRVDVEDIGNTPLGQCIADVGRGTRFPKQDVPTAFRIPVSIRTQGGSK